MADGWQNVQVDDSTMRAFVCIPSGSGPHPAMVIIQGAGGVDNFIQETARRTAASGYTAIAPDLYHRLDPNSNDDSVARARGLDDNKIIEDVNAAVEYIRKQGLATDSIGIMGFCIGGRISFLMAGVNPAFKAAVPFYGGHSMDSKNGGPTTFSHMRDIKCPVLGFFGEDDLDPSPQDMLKIAAELTVHGVPHEFHMYSGTGHRFMDFDHAPGYREYAEKASWHIAIAFLEKHLKVKVAV